MKVALPLKKKWRPWALLLPLAVIALTGCGKKADTAKPDASPDKVTVEMVTAKQGPIETTISAQGTLAPEQGANARVATVVAGRIVAVKVREGDRVQAGQVVAVVDNRPQQAQARSAAAALTASQAQARQSEVSARSAATDQDNSVRLAKLTLQAAQADRDSANAQAKLALTSAQVDLAKTRAGARPQEIAQAEQNVAQDQATRDRAATELERVRFLVEKGIDAQRQLDDAKTALAVAESALESAKQQANLVKAGARAEDLRAAEVREEQARALLEQTRISGDARVAQAQAQLRQAQQSALAVTAKQLEAQSMRETTVQKQADFAAAQATAAYAELRAPLTGVVTRRAANPGDMADPAAPILEITDTHSLNLLANLPADDGMKVRAGMLAHITTADAPGRTFAGRVLSVGQVDPQTNLLAVRLSVSNPTGQLRVGSFALADIVLRSTADAVLVPKQAVISHDNKPVVFVVGSDSVAHQRDVTVGAEQGDQIEILSGVKSGEKLVKLGQYELSDGAKVEEAAPEGATDAADKSGDSKPDGAKDTADKGGDAMPDGAKAATDKSGDAKPESGQDAKGAKGDKS